MSHDKSVATEQAYLRFRQTLIGNAVNEVLHVIDCSESTFDPTDINMYIEMHQKGDRLSWSVEQQSNALLEINNITHNELDGIVAGKSILNANVLDYLLEHQHLIPLQWEGKTIHFLGTRYRDCNIGYLCIRSLLKDRDSEKWSWEYNICDDDLCCLTGYIALYCE